MRKCTSYVGLACIDGSCPVASYYECPEQWSDRPDGCNSCGLYKGCSDCYFCGRSDCSYDAFHLILPIKYKWLKMIASGEKKSEYRAIKPYWTKRFANEMEISDIDYFIDALARDVRFPYLYVIFRAGYSKYSPAIFCQIQLSVGYGNPAWGADGNKSYILFIREIYEMRNFNENRKGV